MQENRNIDNELIVAIQYIQLSVSDDLRTIILTQIEQLIQHDFGRLIQILYSIDVSEEKLKHTLITHKDVNTADVITDLIIQRQIEKWNSRVAYINPTANINCDEERW